MILLVRHVQAQAEMELGTVDVLRGVQPLIALLRKAEVDLGPTVDVALVLSPIAYAEPKRG